MREIIRGWRRRNGDPREHATRLVGLAGFAAALGVSPQYVQKWVATGRVPYKHVLRCEELSGVPRHRIRPDVYPPEREAVLQ